MVLLLVCYFFANKFEVPFLKKNNFEKNNSILIRSDEDALTKKLCFNVYTKLQVLIETKGGIVCKIDFQIQTFEPVSKVSIVFVLNSYCKH